MPRVLLSGLVAISLTGCGSGEEERPWKTIDTVSADLNQFLKAQCIREDRCVFAGKSYSECNDYSVANVCDSFYKDLSLPDLDACVRAMGKAECGVPISECFATHSALNAADGIIKVVAEGERCSGPYGGNAICWAGLTCEGASDSFCGTCAPRHAENQTCDGDAQCLDNLYCKGGRCTRKKKTGKTCESVEECEGTCTLGICEAYPKLNGSKCQSDFECYSERCQGGACTDAPACSSLGAGEYCGASYASCAPEFICDGVCTEAPGAGEACDPQLGERCANGARCTDKMICERIIELGDPCETPDAGDERCLSYYCGPDARCSHAPDSCTDSLDRQRSRRAIAVEHRSVKFVRSSRSARAIDD